MIALLALVPLAVQQTAATKASFHPPAPLVYLEVPDIEVLLREYERAPMVQMARDTVVREVFTKIQAAWNVDLVRDLEAALAGPSKFSGRIWSPQEAIERFPELRSASISIDLAQEAPGDFTRAARQVSECVADIAAIDRALREHRSADGPWPESIQELGLASERVVDPWGRPYAYTIDAQGPRIVSLGADGTNGGVGADADTSNGDSLDTWLGSELQRRSSVIVVLESSSAEQQSEVISWLAGGSTSGDAREVVIDGRPGVVESLRTESGKPDGWRLQWGHQLVVGSEGASIDAAVARAEGRADSVASSTVFEPLTQHAGPSKGIDVARLAVRPAGLSLLAWRFLPPNPSPDANESLLAKLESGAERATLRMQLADQRFVTDLVAIGLAGPWVDAFGKEPVSTAPEGLASVPADAAGVLAMRLDISTVLTELVRRLGLEAGDDLAELEREHAFDLRKDVLDQLAGGVVAYMMPPVTIGVPNATLAFDLVDPAAFEKGVTGLLAAAAAAGTEIKSTKYKSMSLWTIVPSSQESRSPVQVTPSVAIVGKRALVTTNASWMRKEIKRGLEPAEDEPHAIGRVEGVPADVTLIGSMDWGGTIDGLYKIARSALALGGMVQLPFDTSAVNAALPSTAEPFTRFLRPTLGWGRRIEGGFHARVESSFGPETWLSIAALVIAAPAWMERLSTSAVAAPHATGAITDPAVDSDASEAELVETRATLAFLAGRLAVYRIEHKRFPATMGDLCKPTANFPRGFIDVDTLPLDGWKRSYVYEASAAGDTFRLWSPGRNGQDEKGGGDDVVSP